MNPGPGRPDLIKLAERRQVALELRKLGGSYRKIAEQMAEMEGISPDYSESQAHRDVMACLKELREKRVEESANVLRMELERLDDMWAVYYPKAKKGDYAALDRCMTMMDKRARYLGLYAQAAPDEAKEVVIRVAYEGASANTETA
mgnify:CR=1 FL=1